MASKGAGQTHRERVDGFLPEARDLLECRSAAIS